VDVTTGILRALKVDLYFQCGQVGDFSGFNAKECAHSYEQATLTLEVHCTTSLYRMLLYVLLLPGWCRNLKSVTIDRILSQLYDIKNMTITVHLLKCNIASPTSMRAPGYIYHILPYMDEYAI